MSYRCRGIILIDAKSIYDSMHGASGPLEMSEKRTCIEMMGIQESFEPEQVEVRWVHGEANLSNSLTKCTELEQIDSFCRAGSRWASVQDELMLSAKRRRQLGLRPLDENHAESFYLAWNYKWPDMPKELDDEPEDPVSPDEEVYADLSTIFLVKTMRRKPSYRAHEPRK